MKLIPKSAETLAAEAEADRILREAGCHTDGRTAEESPEGNQRRFEDELSIFRQRCRPRAVEFDTKIGDDDTVRSVMYCL